MNNILDYVKWRGDLNFDIMPFNDADAAVLSEFSYVPLKGTVPENFKDKILLGDVCTQCAGREMMPGHEQDIELVKVLAKAPRFSKLFLSGFRKIVDDDEQLCVFMVRLGAGRHLVVFQGTDESLIGWKEDMQFSYMIETPAQGHGVEYMNEAGRAYRGEILTCGHSKGGNLTIYAAAFCNEKISERISRIISFDGPGFNEDVIKKKELKKIKKKIVTYAAEGSLVGMLLEHNTKLIPVKCKGSNGMSQHNLYNWEMGINAPVTLTEFSGLGEMNREALHKWVSGLTYEQREEFVETLFSVFDSQKDIDELFTGKSLASIVRSYAKMDKDKRQALGLVINSLGKSVRTHVLGEIKDWVVERRESAQEYLEADRG